MLYHILSNHSLAWENSQLFCDGTTGKFSSTQKHHPDLGSDISSGWNFCPHSWDVILQGTSGEITKCWVFSSGWLYIHKYQKRLYYCLLILSSYAVKPSLDIAIWKYRYTNLTDVCCSTRAINFLRVACRHCLFSNFADEQRGQNLSSLFISKTTFNVVEIQLKIIIIEAKSKQNKEN